MDFIVSGLVVDGHCLLGYGHSPLAMEPDSSSSPRSVDLETMKKEIKREKNRKSSAKSRQRKKDEDEKNQQKIEELERKNERLRQIIDRLLSEGRTLRELIPLACYTDPDCAACIEATQHSTGLHVPGAICQHVESPDSLMNVSQNS